MASRLVVMATLLLAFAQYSIAGEQGGEERMDALERRIERIEKKMELLMELLGRRADKQGASQTGGRIEELQREVAALEEERDDLHTVGDPAPPDPAAEIPQPRVPINGYMEMHLNHDGINPTTLDFHRFVLLFGYNFGERIQFVSEVELEHALVEGGERSGEIELEQAYLNFLIHPAFNFRAGMMLVPIGIINQTHEPPSFNGVERPFVDEVIIPSTWFSQGAGLAGDLGKGFSYKAFAMSTLNASLFDAAEGFRGGRQKGFFDNARNLAGVGRLEYSGIPSLNLGVSYWGGQTGFDFSDVNGDLRIFEFDGRWSAGRFDARGQFAVTDLSDAGRVNRILQQRTGVSPNIAEQMRGFYLEGAYHFLPEDVLHDLVGFYRYENFDTQYRMPTGFLPLEQFDRSAHVLGVTYSPYPDVALKFDYVFLRNASSVVEAPNQWNFGVGWWF